ncbi:MAG TPA: Holliday junction resolvase RuvX [Candidatus Paceibacterota bacterium]|nr:Holliday junction resolvase RuvX [Candidatus Paceibacterota bacterium]HRZ34204.1 Holliday junction resolvase RuvX [Candidatus Paceibacterota bacterium]
MKYLGIDYGTKRIGVALSDDDGKIAFPKVILENNSKIIEELLKIARKNSVGKIILGESKNFKMEDNEIMTEILDLKKILESELNIDVHLHPEFLTSVEARKITGKSEKLDASAAAIILQDYLDGQNRR